MKYECIIGFLYFIALSYNSYYNSHYYMNILLFSNHNKCWKIRHLLFKNNLLASFIFSIVLPSMQNILQFSYHLCKKKIAFYERMITYSRNLQSSCCIRSQEIYIACSCMNLHIFVMLFHIKQGYRNTRMTSIFCDTAACINCKFYLSTLRSECKNCELT